MTKKDKMLKIIDENSLDLHVIPMKGRIKGLYADDNIFISSSIDTDLEIGCVLAEELGHYNTSYGNILDLNNEISRKQELRARGWAYAELIKFDDIIKAFQIGCRHWNELSEYLQVSEEFLKEAILYFANKYGIYKVVGNYIIYFEPFGVMEMFREGVHD